MKKFGRENSEERCLSRPEARFSPFTRPLLELPNLPVPAALAVPGPASSAGHSQLRAEPQAGSFGSFSRQRLSPHPFTPPAMPGSGERRKVLSRLGMRGRE